jgi:hypothetical protein
LAKKISTILRNLLLTALTYPIKSNVIPQSACICRVFARIRRAKSVGQRRPTRENPAISMTLGAIPRTLGTVPTTKETSDTVKETPSRVMEMTPGWQEIGGGSPF